MQPEPHGGVSMKKCVMVGIALVLITAGWGTMSVGEQVPAPRGELRIVEKHSQKYISVVYNVFEYLIKFDAEGKLVARLGTSWRWLDDRTLEFILRQGVTFHNGEV